MFSRWLALPLIILGFLSVLTAAQAGPPSSYTPQTTPYIGTESWYCSRGSTDGSCNIANLFLNYPRTLQSFGAKGDGATDDTSAVQTALRSGIPLTCQGTFLITSLITVTNINIDLEGGGDSCVFIYNTNQTMVQFSESGSVLYTVNRVTLKGIRVKINAVITAVTGPAHTAAFFITYPLGTPGSVNPIVIVDDVRIGGTSATNYIINGLYLNDINDAHILKYAYEGNRTTVDPNSSALVWDGTHAPTTLFVEDMFADLVGDGIFAPQVAANGWQGIRIRNFDCVFCNIIVVLQGALDSLTNYADISGVEGPFMYYGISVSNTTNVFIHESYMFAYSAITGLTPQAAVVCIQTGWTIPIPAWGKPTIIENNSCDGVQYSHAGSTRYGVIMNGTNNTPWPAKLGTNTLTNLDVGEQLAPNTAGVVVYPPATWNVTTPLSNLATPGVNTLVSSSPF